MPETKSQTPDEIINSYSSKTKNITPVKTEETPDNIINNYLTKGTRQVTVPMNKYGQSKYDRFTTPQNIEDTNINRAFNQGLAGEIGAFAATVLPKIGLGILETTGNLLDLENYAGVLGQTKTDYDNWFSKSMREGKQAINEFAPIYEKEPGETFNPTDSAWWVKNIGGVVESAAEFGVTGAGLGKLIGSGANALRLAGAKKLANAVNTAGQLGTTVGLTHAEGVLTGQQVYQDVLKTQLDKGVDEETANNIAADAAAKSVQLNYINVALNYTSLTPFFRSNNLGQGLIKEELKRLPQESLEAYSKRVAQTYTPSIKNTLKTLKHESAQEAGEEWINIIAQNEGLYQGGAKEMQGDNFFSRAVESALSEEGLVSAGLGAIGGAGQTIISRGLSGKKDNEVVKKTWEKQREAIIQNYGQAGESLAKDIKEAGIIQNEYKKALINKDETKADILKNKLTDLVDYRNFEAGTVEDLQSRLDDMSNQTFTEQGKQDLLAQGVIESTSMDELTRFRTLVNERKQILKENKKIYDNIAFDTEGTLIEPQIASEYKYDLFSNRSTYKDLLKKGKEIQTNKFVANGELQNEISLTGIKPDNKKEIEKLESYQKLQKLEQESVEISEAIKELNKDYEKLNSEEYINSLKKKEAKKVTKEPKETPEEEFYEKDLDMDNFTPDTVVPETNWSDLINKAVSEKELNAIQDQIIKADADSPELTDLVALKRQSFVAPKDLSFTPSPEEGLKLVPRLSQEDEELRKKWGLPKGSTILEALLNEVRQGKNPNEKISIKKTRYNKDGSLKEDGKETTIVYFAGKAIGNLNRPEFIDNPEVLSNMTKLYESLTPEKEYTFEDFKKMNISFSLTKGEFDYIKGKSTGTLLQDITYPYNSFTIVDTNSNKLIGNTEITPEVFDATQSIPEGLGRYIMIIPEEIGFRYIAVYPAKLKSLDKTDKLFSELQNISSEVKKIEGEKAKKEFVDKKNLELKTQYYITGEQGSLIELTVNPEGAARLSISYLDPQTNKYGKADTVFVNNITKEGYTIDNLLEAFNKKLEDKNIVLTQDNFKVFIPKDLETIKPESIGTSFSTYLQPNLVKNRNLKVVFNQEFKEDIKQEAEPIADVIPPVNIVSLRKKAIEEATNQNSHWSTPLIRNEKGIKKTWWDKASMVKSIEGGEHDKELQTKIESIEVRLIDEKLKTARGKEKQALLKQKRELNKKLGGDIVYKTITPFPNSITQKVYYHGTNIPNLKSFSLDFQGKANKGVGLNFTEDPEYAKEYGKYIYKVKLNVSKWVKTDKEAKTNSTYGIDDVDEVVVYHPEQVAIIGNSEVLTQEEIIWLSDNLPDFIKVEDISNLKSRLAQLDSTMGAFKDSIIYLNKQANKGTGYHEAFHAVFRSMLTDRQIDNYLKLADKETGYTKKQLQDKINDLAVYHPTLSDTQLEQLVYEEYLADKFMDWKLNKATQTNSIFKALFKKIVDFFKWLSNSNEDIESLFDAIDKGVFKSAVAQPNRFTSINQAAYKLLPTNFELIIDPKTGEEVRTNATLSQSKSNELLNTFAAKVRRLANEGIEGTKIELLNKVIQERVDLLYSDETENYIDSKPEPLKASLKKKQLDELYTLEDDTALTIIQEQVLNKLAAIQDIDNEDETNTENDEERGTELFNKEAFQKGGESSLSKKVREYINFAMFQRVDEVTGTIEDYAVDGKYVYNAALRALAGVPENKILEKLVALGEDNPNINGVVQMILSDTGITIDEMGKLTEATKNHNTLRQIIVAFKKYKANQIFTEVNPIFNRANKFESMDSRVINANSNDPKKIQLGKWSADFEDLISNEKKDLIKQEIDNINKLLATSKKQESDETIKAKVKEIKESFDKIGINLSSGYIRFSFLKNKNKLSKRQQSFLDAFSEQQPFDFNNTFVELGKSLLDKNISWYDTELGMLSKLGDIAENNAVFDETIGDSSFKNAEGKTVYDIIEGSYVLEETSRINNPIYREELKKDNFIKNNFLINKYNDFLNKLNINITDGIRDKSKDGTNEAKEGVTFGSYSEREYLLDNLAKFAEQNKDKATGITTAYYTFRQNEASNTAYIAKLPVEKQANDNNLAGKEIIEDLFKSTFKPEYDRITNEWKEANKTGEFIGGNKYKYNDKASSRAFTFTEYNYLEQYLGKEEYDKLVESARAGDPINEELIKTNIERYLNEGIVAFKESLRDNGLITLKEGKVEFINLLPKKLVNIYNDINTALAEYYLNDYLMSSSLNQLLDGDYAISRKDKIDVVKRHKGAMGSGPNYGEGTHKVAYIKDIIKYVAVKPEDGNLVRAVKQGDKFISTNGKEYTQEQVAKITSNDAQSYSSIYHKMFSLKRLGRYDNRVKNIYKKLLKDTSWNIPLKDQEYLEQVGASLNSDKTVTFGREVYHKTSEFPLIRGFISYIDPEDKAKYDKLIDELFETEDQKDIIKKIAELYKPLAGKEYWHNMAQQMDLYSVDQVITESASKGETYIPEDSEGEYDLRRSSKDIPNVYKRLQMETPTGKRSITSGTQLMQLIDTEQQDDLEVEINGKKTTIKELRNNYRKLMGKTRSNSFKVALSYIKAFNDGTIDKTKLDKKLERVIAASGGDEFLTEMFSVENGKAKFNFNLLPLIDKAEQIVLAHFSKGVLSQKVNGTSVSLISNSGVKIVRDDKGKVILSSKVSQDPVKYSGYETSDLKHNIKDSETGDIYSECILSERALTKYGLKIGDTIPKEIATMLGYRIPTQDKHSMISLRVVDILPNYMEGSGIFPEEIVYLSGADFDIDKLFIQSPEYYMEKGKAVKYGTEETPEAKFNAFKKYLKTDKEFKYVVKDILLNNPLYQTFVGDINKIKPIESEEDQFIIEEDEEELKILNLLSKEIKDKVVNQAMKYFNYPLNPKDYEEYIKNNGEINNAVINNEILDSQMKLLTNSFINEEIAYTPATSEGLREEAEYIESLIPGKEGLSDKYISTSDINGKYIANSKNSAGKAGIGPVANSLQVFTFLSKSSAKLKEDAYKLTISDDKTKYTTQKFRNKNSNGERIADLLSTILTVMTDNAKDPIAGRMNLKFNLLSTYVQLIMQGVSKRNATLILNTPSVQKYSKLLESGKYAIQTPREAKLKRFNVTKSLFEEYVGEHSAEELKDMLSDKEFKSTDIEKLIKGELSNEDSNLLNAQLLYAWLQIEDQANTLANINTLLKTNKGLPVSFNELESQFDKAVGELGLSGLLEYPSTYKDKSPVDVEELLKNDPHTLSNARIVKTILNTSSKLFITQTKAFKQQLGILYKNLKPSAINKPENRKTIERDFLGFISTQSYIHKIQELIKDNINPKMAAKFSKRLELMNDSLIFPELEKETLAKQLLELKRSDNELIRGNVLVRYLTPKFKFNITDEGELVENEDNKKRMDTVESRTFAKESPQLINSLIDGYKQLYNEPSTQEFAINMFNYLIVKDNLSFKSGSFVKFLAPFMFKQISESLDNSINELSKENPDFKKIYGKDFKTLAYDFRQIFNRYIPNKLYLNYRSEEVNSNGKIKTILGLDKTTTDEKGFDTYKALTKYGNGNIKFDLFTNGYSSENREHMQGIFDEIIKQPDTKEGKPKLLYIFPEFYKFDKNIYKLVEPLDENGDYISSHGTYQKVESFGYRGVNPYSKSLEQNIDTYNKTKQKVNKKKIEDAINNLPPIDFC